MQEEDNNIGYIQEKSFIPLSVVMHSDLSITAANESIKNRAGTLYFDATGSVVKKVNDKKIFYYSKTSLLRPPLVPSQSDLNS